VTRQLGLHVLGLPDTPTDAAREFYEVHLPTVRDALEAARARSGESTLTLMFPPADHTHRAWRLAAVQGLAREQAPVRINGLIGEDEARLKEALAYLAEAPGITGQLLEV
jgi:hypothetical protein